MYVAYMHNVCLNVINHITQSIDFPSAGQGALHVYVYTYIWYNRELYIYTIYIYAATLFIV